MYLSLFCILHLFVQFHCDTHLLFKIHVSQLTSQSEVEDDEIDGDSDDIDECDDDAELSDYAGLDSDDNLQPDSDEKESEGEDLSEEAEDNEGKTSIFM